MGRPKLPETTPPSGGRPAPGAAELLRSVGLLADGPATWGTPVRSNRPGVYLVELPSPPAAAPIDFNIVGRWIERVPTLTLDGLRPTGRDLAARLHGFWLPDQPILYIGMSGASIGSRVAAFARTPLGDRKPYAGGHWLKTLAVLDRIRVWWAETDAPEEYEDALLGAFAGGVPAETVARLHDPRVLPFANLQTADGVRKNHGIRGSLLTDESPGPVSDADRRTAAGRAAGARAGGRAAGRAATGRASDPTRNTGILRSRNVLGAAGSASPRPRPPRTAGETAAARAARNAREAGPTVGRRAPRAPTRLSASGLQALRDELEQLATVTRPAIVARISAARELGDLKENSDYQEARREQSFAEGRIRAIEDLLRHVEVIEDGHDEGRARLGSTVVVEDTAGVEDRFTLVGSSEANPASGRISASSPIGAALLDRSAGEEVEVIVPSGRRRYRILEVS